MSAIEQAILGSGVLYDRLCLITEVLGRFVSSAPRAVDIAQLEKYTGRSARELLRLCAVLCREELLRPHPELPHCWILARNASQVTLEDAFRCAINEQTARARPARTKVPAADGAPCREVDMLVMQATMGINQSIFQHLRQFSLDRLKVSAASMFGGRRVVPDPWAHSRLSFS